jgi:hypothetical protein
LAGCGGSSSDTDASGYLKFYNASSNSPYIYLSLDEVDYTGANYGHSSGMYELTSTQYEMELSYKEGSNDFNIFDEQEIQITDEKVNLVMLTGDISTPEVITYRYDDEDPETEDDVFTFRVVNMHQQSPGIDIYIAKDDETFNEAVLLGSYAYKDMSDSHYIDLDSYKYYLTETGSNEVIYESADIGYIYTTQYILVIRENTGPSNSSYTIDQLSKTSSISYPDKNARAELKLYNGLTQHELLPQFSNQIDVSLTGVNGNDSVTALARGEFSQSLDLSFGDYALDFTATGDETAFARNHFVSLASNSDKTVFVYHTEVEDPDDGDDNTIEETNLYVNTLSVDNSTRVSLYDHQINVINLVDDFDHLNIHFVRSNETVETAEYKVTSTRAAPRSVTLENNSYDVNILVDENESELLLAFDQITLDADSSDLFMVIEEDANVSSGYSVKFVKQNEE